MTTYELIRGDDNRFVLIVETPDEDEPRRMVRTNLTLCDVEILAKEAITDLNEDAVFWCGTVDSGATYETLTVREQAGDDIGKVDVLIPVEATADMPDTSVRLIFDVVVTDSNASPSTVMFGQFTVRPDVNEAVVGP